MNSSFGDIFADYHEMGVNQIRKQAERMRGLLFGYQSLQGRYARRHRYFRKHQRIREQPTTLAIQEARRGGDGSASKHAVSGSNELPVSKEGPECA